MKEDSDPNISWVTIDGFDYEVEEDKILEWLRLYGEMFGRLRENIHQDDLLNSPVVGAGTNSIKMRLDSEIPQLLPMYGKKVTVTYKGVHYLNLCIT